MLRKLLDGLIYLIIFIGWIASGIKRHPKLALGLALEVYALVCFFHLWLYDGSKLFFSISAAIATLAALFIILTYKNPNTGRYAVDVLSTEADTWYAARERA